MIYDDEEDGSSSGPEALDDYREQRGLHGEPGHGGKPGRLAMTRPEYARDAMSAVQAGPSISRTLSKSETHRRLEATVVLIYGHWRSKQVPIRPLARPNVPTA